jgi:hypothetical protein
VLVLLLKRGSGDQGELTDDDDDGSDWREDGDVDTEKR